MDQLKKIFEKAIENPYIYRLYTLRLKKPQKMRLFYKAEDLNLEYYDRIKDLGYREFEHQIGRLTNFKKIVRDCVNLEGDFVEFGCWRGFSLLWTAYFMERNAIFDKKLIGLDGFIGLPYTDGGFRKGKFANTSRKECRDNLLKSDELYDEIKKRVFVGKFLYEEKESILNYFNRLKSTKLCFIHIDCDISQSAKQIFEILIAGDLIADKAYILFDDYGIEVTLREEIENFFDSQRAKWNITVHSETKLTKNFIFEKKK
jgi:hypothetical protein